MKTEEVVKEITDRMKKAWGIIQSGNPAPEQLSEIGVEIMYLNSILGDKVAKAKQEQLAKEEEVFNKLIGDDTPVTRAKEEVRHKTSQERVLHDWLYQKHRDISSFVTMLQVHLKALQNERN